MNKNTRHRRPVFWFFAFLIIAAGIEAGSWVLERVENLVARNRNPYVEAVNKVPAFEVVDSNGRKMVQRSRYQMAMTVPAPFPLVRPEGGLRVFFLGGSAAAGWPYNFTDYNNAALLEAKLKLLYPGRSVEVVNMGGGTYGSHRVKLILEEVIQYNPDLIVLYNGNNEFLENLVFRQGKPPSPWNCSATARIIYRLKLAFTTPKPSFDVKNYELSDQISNRLSFAFSKASRYRTDPDQFRLLLDFYRYNMDAMVTTAQEAKIPLLLVTCPVNLKDWTPNVSRHRKDLQPADKSLWTSLFREGVLALERNNPAAAAAPLAAAVALDDEYAEAHFLLGEALRRLGKSAEAKAAYLRALERDAFPFRELPEFQKILREIASQRKVPLVDVIPPLEAVAGGGILGDDLFIDYVHLAQSGQEIVAHEVVRVLLARGLLPGILASDVERTRIQIPDTFPLLLKLEQVESTYHQYMVMRQYAKLDSRYNELCDVMTRTLQAFPDKAEYIKNRRKIYDRIQTAVIPYRKLLRAEKLGLLQETFAPDEAEKIYQNYVKMLRWSVAKPWTDEAFKRALPSTKYRPAD